MIKIVLWDIDGTLTNFKAAEEVSIKNCFKKFKLGRCSKEMLEKYSKINTSYWQMLERKEISKPELLVKRFDDFFALYGINCDSKKFNEQYQEELRENVVISKGAKEAVAKLEEMNIPQYVVTNGLVESQNKKLHNIGLDNKFIKVFISDEIGYDKPSVEFFKPVFAEIKKTYPNINKDEIMIIGDSLTSDIQGGINVGIKTCWYNLEHQEGNLQCDYEIDNLNKVLEILGEIKMEEKKTTKKKASTEKKTTTKKTTAKKAETKKPVEKKTEVKEEVEKAVESKVIEPETKIKTVEEVVNDSNKKGLKEIVDKNYRAIIVCLAAIALLFVCLFIGTSGKKNTYALSDVTTLETEEKITLPKKWYLAEDQYYGYYSAYELDGEYLNQVMTFYSLDGYDGEYVADLVEQLEGTYEVSEETYSGNIAYVIRNINESDDTSLAVDYVFYITSENNVIYFGFTGVSQSTEASILQSIK